MATRYPAPELCTFAIELLTRAGLEADKANVVAEILLEGDLLGHDTHGLALLPAYLTELERGGMARTGEPKVLADFPAAVTWDGQRLPGPWLTVRALDLAMERARKVGTCTIAIRRSHHVACLAAYLGRVAKAGFAVILTCSDPSVSTVAPHGGKRAAFTPNPIAAAWPTEGDPVVLDVSMSIATNGLTNRLRTRGERFPGKWALTSAGDPTDDPQALFTTPPGALLPVGGIDHGHKGYALGLLVEALTGGLGGAGRASPPEGWTANVFLQVLAPELFSGEAEFRRETEHMAALCRATPPRPGVESVRLPGEAGFRRRADQLAQGVALHEGILPALTPWAEKMHVPLPAAS